MRVQPVPGPVPGRPVGNRLPPGALGDLVISHLVERGAIAPISSVRVGDLIRGFANYLAAAGVESLDEVSEVHAASYVRSLTRNRTEPSIATMHLRRTALRLLFREARALGLVSLDPTASITLPRRSYSELRPLTDEEVDRCRSFTERTEGESRFRMAWALGEATARVTELSAIRAHDLDLASSRVWISGSSSTEPRWAELTVWGLDQLRSLKFESKAAKERFLLGSAARASAHELLASTLRLAGLAKVPGARPNSVPAWRGAKAIATGASIHEVALLLGMRSLDRTASFIGFDWRAAP